LDGKNGGIRGNMKCKTLVAGQKILRQKTAKEPAHLTPEKTICQSIL
jgi:hypothetical protein